MPVIKRSPRPESNFYILNKSISEDKRLSWAARGMLVFLLGKPDYWEVSPAALINETEGARIHSGRDAVWALLRELVDAGYCTRDQRRGEDGLMGAVDYYIHETPRTANPGADESPDTDKPCAESEAPPHTDQPGTANPTQVSIEVKQGLKKKQGLKSYDVSADFADVDPQVLGDWIALRVKRRAPVTATVAKSIRSESMKAGMSVEDAMRLCCLKGWQGFDASWVTRDRQQPTETPYAKAMRQKYEAVAPSVAARRPTDQVRPDEIFDITPKKELRFA